MFAHVEKAIKDIQQGETVLVTDSELRENEGDIVMAARFATAQKINFLLNCARGMICVPMEKNRAQKLNLWPMVPDKLNTEYTHCTFLVSVDRLSSHPNCKTGVSAQARAQTVERLGSPRATAEDFTRPGHTFPLIARDWGTLERAGHTEATVDLMKLSGIHPAVGVLCEVLKPDGRIARLRYLKGFSQRHGITMISIYDIVEYRKYHERLIECAATSKLPTRFGLFKVHAFRELINGKEHIALTMGVIKKNTPTIVRVHSRCLTGDIFSSLRCDCQDQLHASLQMISQRKSGVLVYLNQEGRDIGIIDKIKSYALQDQGYDTVEANERLGYKADERRYHIGTQILRALNVGKMELITNNPGKILGLEQYGLEITQRIPLEIKPNALNKKYLSTKRDKLGHLLH